MSDVYKLIDGEMVKVEEKKSKGTFQINYCRAAMEIIWIWILTSLAILKIGRVVQTFLILKIFNLSHGRRDAVDSPDNQEKS